MLCKSIGNHTYDAIFASVSSLSLSIGIAYRQNFWFEWNKKHVKVWKKKKKKKKNPFSRKSENLNFNGDFFFFENV